MDDRISKNIHRELRTMNGKLDEMGVVSRILTDSIKEQTAEMKRKARQKTPKIGGLAVASASSSASASAESNFSAKMSTMITALQRQVMSLSVTNSPTVSVTTNVDASLSGEVKIENTNELAVSIAQQLSSSLSQQMSATLASVQSQSISALVQVSTTVNGKSGKKEENKSKSLLDWLQSGFNFVYQLNDEVTKIRDAKENTKLVKEFLQKEKNEKSGDSSKCCCTGDSGGTGSGEGSDVSTADETSEKKKDKRKKKRGTNRRLSQAKYGKRRANKTISRSKSKNFERPTYKKKNDFRELGRASQGQNRAVGNSPHKNLGQAANAGNGGKGSPAAGSSAGQKLSASPALNPQQDLSNSVSGTGTQGQGTPQNNPQTSGSKSGSAPGKNAGGGLLGKAKKYRKWGILGAAVGSVSMRLFGGGEKAEEEGNSDSTTVQTSAVIQSTAETVQTVQSMSEAAKAASTASNASKVASATKKVGWLGKLLKGARTVSKATRFLRWNPVGFLGGLAVDAGLWAAEKFLLPKDEENQDNENIEDDKKKTSAMVRSNIFAKNRVLAASTSSTSHPFSGSRGSFGPAPDSDPSGTMTLTSSASNDQTLNMPGTSPAASGSMEVSANSNVTMNLNVNGYIDNRMIEEIKRIAREQYDASFRAFQRSIEDKLPKPKPFPRPQVAEGGMMSY